MNRFPCAVASAVLVALCGASTAFGQCVAEATYCEPVGVEAFWADNCTSPNIIVRGPGRDDSVIICQEGDGYWKIAVAYEAPGTTALSLVVSGGGVVNRNIASVGASVNDGLFTGHSVLIRFLDRINDVRGVGYDSGDIFALLVDGTIQGDLGHVIATSIGSKTDLVPLLVEGDVHGPIWLRDPASSAGIVEMRVLGDILGNITIEYGGIDLLEVVGTIRGVGGGGAVVPSTIKTYGDIDELIAGEIIANITAGDASLDSDPTPADIYTLRTTTVNGGTGDFIGAINARKIVTQLDIRGGLGGGEDKEAIITLLDPLGIPAGIRIGGSFREDSQINLPSNGLTGTILFNAEDDSGVWESGGVITVGSTPLSQATYSTLPSAVGGGVAGLTDSGFFGAACSPAANSIRSLWPPAYLGDCDDPPTFSGGIAHADLRFRTAVDVDGDSFTVLRTGLGASRSTTRRM